MAELISKETIDAVSRATDIVSVVSEYVHLEQKGNQWWGCCPFHSEKTPSFSVTPDKNLYYCFGCHAGGNVTKFIMEMEKISFPEAIKILAKKSGVRIEYENGGAESFQPVDNTKELLIDLYTKVSGSFHYLLTQTQEGKSALGYILSRGLSMETIEKFKLGYSPANRRWLKVFLRQKKYSDEFLEKSGLFSKKYPDVAFFSDRLMFPIFDRHGQVVAFGGRRLREDEEGMKSPKYLNSGDLIQYKKGETLYAFNFAKNSIQKEKKVIFCEGYMDCIAYHQCGITYAVAPLGTALTDEQIKLVKGFVNEILLSFDSDGAGQNATKRAILMCRQHNITAKVIKLQGGKDPAEIMLKFGKESLTNDINCAILDSDYLLKSLAQEFPVDTPEGKVKACLGFFSYIDALQTDIQKESCLELVSQTFKISMEAVRRDYLNRDSARNRSFSETVDDKIETSIKVNAELRTLLAVLSDTSKFEMMIEEISDSDFEDPVARNMFSILKQCYQQDNLSFEAVVNHCQDNSLQQFIIGTIASGEFKTNTEQMIKDGIAMIKNKSLEKKRDDLLEKIEEQQRMSPQNIEELKRLIAEKMDIDRKLKQ
ncbi:DNA primase [Treponema zioleckii]|uniref:DNA primase n=1 Tax=Treponema zioleckii TaxID=331680 RepID=UPI00168B8886|nr:DNA primase [Treponema zioleckii]